MGKSLIDQGIKISAPAQMRAFQAAKKSCDSTNTYGDDFVEWKVREGTQDTGWGNIVLVPTVFYYIIY